MRKSIEERFWAKVNKDGPVPEHMPHLGPCWVWTGSRFPLGYGTVSVASRQNQGAHRVSWRLTQGPIPEGLMVCHRCDNRPCVRPSHLFLSTAKGNFDDMVRKGRRNVARGDRLFFARHPEMLVRGENHRCAKLTEEQVRELRARVAAGERQADLAREAGISRASMSKMILRESWKHVT